MSFKVIRCAQPTCGRFLGHEDIKLGKVRLKCPRCKNWTVIIADKIKEGKHVTYKSEQETELDNSAQE